MTTFAELAARGSLIVNDGYRTKASELGEPGYPILRVAEISVGSITPSYGDHVRGEYRDKIGYKLSRAGDVLLTTKGTVGRRAIMPEHGAEFAYSPQLCFFRVLDDSINSRWLYYWLGGAAFWGQAVGVSQQTDMAPYISLRDLRAIEIDIPRREVQDAIAETLGALDDKIESNRRTLEHAHNLLDAIANKHGISQPPVPLGSLTELTRSTVDPSTMGDVVVDHFSLPAFDTAARPERVRASTIMSNKIGLNGNSILVSRLNPRTNRTWWSVPSDGVPALASTEFAVLTAAADLNLAALWLAVRDTYFRDELARRVTGTSGSHQRVRPNDFLTIEVPDVRRLPDGVTSTALALLQLMHQRREESARLIGLRDALLPELLSGRTRLPEAADTITDELLQMEDA